MMSGLQPPLPSRTSTMSHPTCCCSVSLDRCDRCDLLVGLEGFHLMSVARTPDALVLDVESCNQLVGLGFLCGSGASNAPHRSHQRTLSNQAEKPPEATATPPTTNSECSSSPEAQMPPPALNSEEPQMHVSSPRDWTAQINSKCSHTTEPLHVRNGSGVQVPLDSRATDRGAPSS